MTIRMLSAALFAWFCCAAATHASDDPAGAMSKGGSPSPDGSKIAFVADFAGTGEAMYLWTINLDGSGLHRIDTGLSSEDGPAWSPDGSEIVFAARGSHGNTDIWIVHPDGTGLVRLTHGLDDEQPAWSPDGRRVAYASNAGGTSDIWIMDADGRNAQRLTSLPGEEEHPSFSPSGDRIVFSESDPASFTANLLIVRATPSATPQPLTSHRFHDWHLSWGRRASLSRPTAPRQQGTTSGSCSRMAAACPLSIRWGRSIQPGPATGGSPLPTRPRWPRTRRR